MDPIKNLIDKLRNIEVIVSMLGDDIISIKRSITELESENYVNTTPSFSGFGFGTPTPHYSAECYSTPFGVFSRDDIQSDVATYDDLAELVRLMTKLGVSDDLKNRVLTSTTGYLRRNPPMSQPSPVFSQTGYGNPTRNDAIDSLAHTAHVLYGTSENIKPDQEYGNTNFSTKTNKGLTPITCLCGHKMVVNTSESTKFKCPSCGKKYSFSSNNHFGSSSCSPVLDVTNVDDVVKDVIDDSNQMNTSEEPETDNKIKDGKEVL